jgi:hypothetical protein
VVIFRHSILLEFCCRTIDLEVSPPETMPLKGLGLVRQVLKYFQTFFFLLPLLIYENVVNVRLSLNFILGVKVYTTDREDRVS